MELNYNIGDLLNQAFGINSVAISQKAYKNIEILEDEYEVDRLSYLGTPIIHTLKLKGQQYRTYDDTGRLTTVQLSDFEMPAVTLATFSRGKNISKTMLTAGYGTVKEMYGFGDWEIDIRGLCLRDPKHATAKTAHAQHLRLQEFEKVAEAIPVVSKLFNDKGIDAIVIEKIFYDQLEGRPGVIPFRLQCVSDRPTELIL